ncbi:MAG TPA: hypothetical protein VN700_19535 [Vicinamibacterales bacterium]|nr:hypothetical protein [Vicinamibacterales bacterium]
MRSLVRTIGVVVAGAILAVQPLAAQGTGKSLGSVNVSRKVVANGQPLAAGTYTLRLLPEDLSKVVGQTPAESRWVEFVRGGKVAGKEVATVLTGPEAKTVAKGGTPASGSSKTELLKGNDYLRIWVNQGGTQYLVHLAIAK